MDDGTADRNLHASAAGLFIDLAVVVSSYTLHPKSPGVFKHHPFVCGGSIRVVCIHLTR